MVCNSDSYYWNFINFKAIYGFVRVWTFSWCHSICLIHSSSICIQNTTREPEQFFICLCCCCHWQWQRLFLICIMLSSLKRILSRQFYSIYALDLLATYNSNIGCHSLSQSWDPRLVNLLRLVGKRKSGWKAQKGRNYFVVLLMDKLYPDLDYLIRKKSDYVLDFCLTEINNAIF